MDRRLLALLSGVLLGTLSESSLAPALPLLQQAFAVGPEAAQGVVSMGLLGAALAYLPVAGLAGRWGGKALPPGAFPPRPLRPPPRPGPGALGPLPLPLPPGGGHGHGGGACPGPSRQRLPPGPGLRPRARGQHGGHGHPPGPRLRGACRRDWPPLGLPPAPPRRPPGPPPFGKPPKPSPAGGLLGETPFRPRFPQGPPGHEPLLPPHPGDHGGPGLPPGDRGPIP